MRKRWKEWKPWARWLTLSAAGVILLAGAGIGTLQYKLHSTSLEDIQARQAAKQNGSTPEAGTPASGAPGALKDPLAKANEFTDKPISAQDALDAAAILSQAGLSMKEMSYLTGKADAGLPVEEKQRIRDLLLSKLTPEQIHTLRSITEPYGKKLVILDKDYPIELVGVYDEAERQKIIKEIHERRQASAAKPPAAPDAGGQAAASAGPSAAPVGEGGGSKASGGASGSGTGSSTTGGSAPSASGGTSKPEPSAAPAEASKPAAPAGAPPDLPAAPPARLPERARRRSRASTKASWRPFRTDARARSASWRAAS
ncbi:hypothetical protein N6H14_06020 [Paenibacillus sp. CC-CFT747]|nr:hypothetical protein N6H14_06020 [Paenibacillus sp. CC-CFT747]